MTATIQKGGLYISKEWFSATRHRVVTLTKQYYIKNLILHPDARYTWYSISKKI